MIDYHTHSLYSFDVDKETGATIEEICEQAVKIGLTGIAITDHYEIASEHDKKLLRDEMTFDVKRHREDVMLAKEKYMGKLDVLYGVELGSPSHDPEFAKCFKKENGFEFVIVSSHRIKGMEDFFFIDYGKETSDNLFNYWKRYLQELKDEISLGIGDTLAHITYPYRYFKRFGREDVLDMEHRYKEYFEDVLKLLIEKDMALEVNTSGLRQNMGDTLPNGYIVDFYRELGGKKITMGSDAHRKEDIGAGFCE